MPHNLNRIAFLWEQENLKERVLAPLNAQTSLLMRNQQLEFQKPLSSWWLLGSRKITEQNPASALTDHTNPRREWQLQGSILWSPLFCLPVDFVCSKN